MLGEILPRAFLESGEALLAANSRNLGQWATVDLPQDRKLLVLWWVCQEKWSSISFLWNWKIV